MQHGTKRIAVVTGASSGIGRAIALRLAAEGYLPVLVGRNPDALRAVAVEAERLGAHPRYLCADLSEVADVARLARQVLEDLGGVDVLIHSAGVSMTGTPIRSAGDEVLDQHFHVNVRAPYLLTRSLLPLLGARKGQVVFINSTVGLRSKGNAAAYGMSKHALRALADSLREEVNAEGIRVLSVFVGRTATPMQAQIHRAENLKYVPERLLQPEDVAAAVANSLSLPPTAEVTDIHIRPMMKSY